MILVKAEVIKQRVVIRRQVTLTVGMVGAQVAFRFDNEWDGLTKIAVFRQGDVVRDAPNITDVATIPSECLAIPGEPLWIGVYGAKPDGTVVIPTIESETDPIMPGSDPSGDPGTDPALPVWQQALNAAANPPKISDRGTWLIFDAINGVYVDSGINAVGSGGGSSNPGEDGATFIPVVSSEGVISWSNDKGLPNPEPVNIKGAPGDPGYTPQKGVDYFDGKPGDPGTSVTVKSVSESAEDGGSNVVTFSDGKTVTVKNGRKGNPGDPGYTPQKGIDYSDGQPGYSPQRGVDYWTASDIAEIKSYVDDAILGGEW